MKIKCPDCGTHNELECGQFECGHCHTALSGRSYEASTSLVTGIVGAAILVGAGHYAIDRYYPSRLPLKVEYEIVRSCISDRYSVVFEADLRRISALCVCATEKASERTLFSELGSAPKSIAAKMREAIKECQ
jgi:hypothetical protein